MSIGGLAITTRSVQRLALFLALLLVFCLGLRGITAATLHPDQMALLPLFKEGLLPFNPGWFEKPPFYTYTNYFLSVLPAAAIAAALDLSTENRELLTLVWSRLVTVLHYLASIGLFHAIVRKSFGTASATLLTILLATSAGLIAHIHFLTADIPLITWMLAAFYFSHRVLLDGRLSSYLLAGLFTGVATATKYNGLAIGIAIAAAHYLRVYYLERRPLRIMEAVFPPRLALGIGFVALGFVLANPFSILDYRTFFYDFVHNYKVAPVYEGQAGSSYAQFFLAMIEVVGIPGFLLLVAGWTGSWVLSATTETSRLQKASMGLAAAVVILYYLKFAPFPRLETRFVLPIVPIAALVPALAVARIRQGRTLLVTIIALIAGYNAVCAYVTGGRFNDDPRLAAAEWLSDNIPAHDVVEMDIYSPSWRKREGAPVETVAMPFVSGRERLFKQLFKDDRFVVGTPDYYRRIDEMTQWYSARALAERGPDFLVINSLYYGRFTEPGPRQALYPSMGEFFRDLLAQRLGYRIVFDKTSAALPWWIYPQNLDFQKNRITIMVRASASDQWTHSLTPSAAADFAASRSAARPHRPRPP